MGFLSKLIKKAKPLLPLALPFALSWGMGSEGLAGMFGKKGALEGLGSLFSGMNPMAKNMLMQSAMGYGTAALTGSKHPGRAAMWSGLASLPFSYMKGAEAADLFNKKYAGVTPMEEGVTGRVWEGMKGAPYAGEFKDVVGQVADPTYKFEKMTPWDILRGSKVQTDKIIAEGAARNAATRAAAIGQELPTYDFFSKISPGGRNRWTGAVTSPGSIVRDWTPTIASQAAGLYGGRMTDEEKWQAIKEKRKKELAWVYGIDPSEITGETVNPFYTEGDYIGGFGLKSGGIASLENGGDVSGPGTGTSDSINANLSDGEFVMTAKAVENLGGGDRYEGARQMYDLMNILDPESETMSEVV